MIFCTRSVLRRAISTFSLLILVMWISREYRSLRLYVAVTSMPLSAWLHSGTMSGAVERRVYVHIGSMILRWSRKVYSLVAWRRKQKGTEEMLKTINVIDNGADPSGKSDSTQAIRDAIADTGATGVLAPAGLYRLSGMIKGVAPAPAPAAAVEGEEDSQAEE